MTNKAFDWSEYVSPVVYMKYTKKGSKEEVERCIQFTDYRYKNFVGVTPGHPEDFKQFSPDRILKNIGDVKLPKILTVHYKDENDVTVINDMVVLSVNEDTVQCMIFGTSNTVELQKNDATVLHIKENLSNYS
jgi:hypothetical protein